jgi:lipopolysaccharide export system permease protein
LADIVYSKPAFDIREGVFYDKIEGFSIKIGRKESDSVVHDVIIYERGSNNLQDNFIIADRGTMRVTPNKRFLEFNLRDGWRYQEKGDRFSTQTEFIRIGFKEYIKQFDLSSLGFEERTPDSLNRSNHRMQSMRQLSRSIDSIQRDINKYSEKVKKDIFAVFSFARFLDSNDLKTSAAKLPVNKFDELIPDSNLFTVNQKAASMVGSIVLNAEIAGTEYKTKQRDLRAHKLNGIKKSRYLLPVLSYS